MNEDTELYRAATARRESAAHAPRMGRDPAAEGVAAMRGASDELVRALKGADPHLDAALQDLTALEREASAELETVARLEEAARRGVLSPERATDRAAGVGAEAERRFAVQARAAERALEKARESVIGQLLPEPPLDTATAMRRDELGRLLSAAKVSSSPTGAFEAVYRDRAASGDRAGIATLLSGWGRATFLEAGGTEERWRDVRLALARRAAEGPLKESPVAAKLRRLHGSEASRALMAARGGADAAVKRLTDRGRA